MNEIKKAPLLDGAKESSEAEIRRQLDCTNCHCECHQIHVLQLAAMSMMLDRLERLYTLQLGPDLTEELKGPRRG